jgi:hypothetical protein
MRPVANSADRGAARQPQPVVSLLRQSENADRVARARRPFSLGPAGRDGDELPSIHRIGGAPRLAPVW